MAKETQVLDTELEGLPAELRWREWMGRVEAALFASAVPVRRTDLAKVVGKEASVDLLIDGIQVDLMDRPYEVIAVEDGWTMRTRPKFARAIQAAADVKEQTLDLNPYEAAVLGAIAYHQPLSRVGLKEIFGKDVSRDLIGRLRAQELITMGPRSPRAGAPYTYVTTQRFLLAFGLESLRDLPDQDLLEDADPEV